VGRVADGAGSTEAGTAGVGSIAVVLLLVEATAVDTVAGAGATRLTRE